MEKELLAFAIGFMVSHALSVVRISLFKKKIRLYETYVHERLDEATELLRKSLMSR